MSMHALIQANMMMLDENFQEIDLDLEAKEFYLNYDEKDVISRMIDEFLRDFDKM